MRHTFLLKQYVSLHILSTNHKSLFLFTGGTFVTRLPKGVGNHPLDFCYKASDSYDIGTR